MPAPTRLIIFDDFTVSLAPLTDLRAGFELRTGALTTLERLLAAFPEMSLGGVFVSPALAPVVRERLEVPVNDAAAVCSEPLLLVNGRCVLPPEGAADLAPGSALTSASGRVLAAHLDAGAARSLLDRFALPAGCAATTVQDARVLERPWDVIRHRNAALAHDLEILLNRVETSPDIPASVIDGDAVRVAPSARVYPGVVLDAQGGPIVIAEGATIRPNAAISGPTYVGPGATVLDGAVLRGNTAIGPVCKVNGEVSGSIFQGYANKAHDGFLGDSFVGEWANLGAGTITSNLLNTYATVAAAPAAEAEREPTGLTFLGSIFGDHVKTAIGTRLVTGSLLGTGAMVATNAPPPACVRNFAWLTEGRTQLYRLSRFLDVCEIVMGRRDVRLTDAQRTRLRDLHDAETSRLVAPPTDYQI